MRRRLLGHYTRRRRSGQVATVRFFGAAFMAGLATRQVEAWSREANPRITNPVVLAALARSVVAPEVRFDSTPPLRVFTDYCGAATIVGYVELGQEWSDVVVRDLGWLADLFPKRRLGIVGVSLDRSRGMQITRDEVAFRGFPFIVLADTTRHAALVRRHITLPAVFLFDRHGNLVHATVDIDRRYHVSYWGSKAGVAFLDSVLTANEAVLQGGPPQCRDADATP